MSQEKLSTIFSIANTISGRPLLETWDQIRIELLSRFCSQHFVPVHWFFPFDSTVISVVFRAIFFHLKRSEQLGPGSSSVFKVTSSSS
jgi:hypothetical protein